MRRYTIQILVFLIIVLVSALIGHYRSNEKPVDADYFKRLAQQGAQK